MTDERSKKTLGSELARLRTKAGYTVRGFAKILDISPSYLSDIERDRRRPKQELLRRMVKALEHAGADFEDLDSLNPRVELDLLRWADETPEVRQMLRTVKDSSRDPREILRELEHIARRDKS
jgi:transcriptional regulator with XRE-family HTH domain